MKANSLLVLMRPTALAVCAGLILSLTSKLHAQATAPALYHVTIDTSQLANHPAGAFSLQLSLYDGSATGDGNSTVRVTNVNFGTNGLADSDPDTDGGVSGNVSTNVTLTDTSAENNFAEEFTPGSTLTFDVLASLSLTTNGVSDEFEIAITDSDGERIPTLDVNADDSLARLTTSDGASINVEAYSTDPTVDPVASGPPVSFGPLVLLDGTNPPPPPILSMSANNSGGATIQWPSPYSNFTLQESPDLVNWSAVPIETFTSGTNNIVVVNPGGAMCQFYRLAQ